MNGLQVPTVIPSDISYGPIPAIRAKGKMLWFQEGNLSYSISIGFQRKANVLAVLGSVIATSKKRESAKNRKICHNKTKQSITFVGTD